MEKQRKAVCIEEKLTVINALEKINAFLISAMLFCGQVCDNAERIIWTKL